MALHLAQYIYCIFNREINSKFNFIIKCWWQTITTTEELTLDLERNQFIHFRQNSLFISDKTVYSFQKILLSFGCRYFCATDISATDISATDISATYNKKDTSAKDISATYNKKDISANFNKKDISANFNKKDRRW